MGGAGMTLFGKWSVHKSLFFDQMRKGVRAKIQKMKKIFTPCPVRTYGFRGGEKSADFRPNAQVHANYREARFSR